MNKLWLTGALLTTTALAVGSLDPQAAVGQQQNALVIQGATLIDGNGGAPVPNSAIVVEGNRITAVGRAGQVQVPAGAQVIDAAGKWVTPGLIDAKANWNWMYGEAYLHWGVTSAMVTGARNDEGIAERDAVDHGIFPGPRLYQGVINMQGGGPNGEKKDNYRPGAGGRVAGTVEAAVTLAHSNLDGGADFIGTNDGDGPPEIFAAYAKVAHDAGKGVVMRCVGPQTRGRDCVLAGADVMIHTGELGVQMNKDYDKWKNFVGLPPDAYCDMDPQKEKDMIAFLVQHATAPEPDFMAADRGFPSSWARVQKEDVEVFDDPNLRAYYPEFAIRDVQQNEQPPEKYLTPEIIKTRMCGFKNHAKFIGDLTAAGGQAVVASDSPQTPPGFGVLQEMAVFQEDAHVPPMKVLQAATSWVADHFKINDIGRIEVGKLADIDIVNADPSKDVLNMRKLDSVIKDGKVVDRSYHPWYRGGMFANDPQHEPYGPNVTGLGWERGLKAATFNRKPFFGLLPLGPEPKVPDPGVSPTPGIEDISLHTLIQGTPDTEVTITGINFVKRSVAYAGEIPLPTEVMSKTELKTTIPANLLADAGKLHITIRNPEPLSDYEWGSTSNTANILVPFSFTMKWSHNKY
jgi:Amidohydrolase family